MLAFRSLLLTICAALYCVDQVLETTAYDKDVYNSRYYYQKGDGGPKMKNAPESMHMGKGKGIFSKYKYRSDQSKGENAKEKEAEIVKREEAVKKRHEAIAPKDEVSKPHPKAPAKAHAAKGNETEAEKAERIHRTFEKLLTFVEIVGQVDNYVSTKWKNIVKAVSNVYEQENDESRVGVQRLKDCPIQNET